MAHELEYQNGTASMFSVVETPWHREGHILTSAPSFDEALVLANLDYLVEKQPTFRQVNDGADYVQNDKAYITVRTDRDAELGSVGPDYQPLQNRDAFRALEPLLDSGVATLETGGVLRDGGDAWLQARFDVVRFGPVVREVFADEVIPFALLTNNHTGRRNATVAATPIRVVCANTLGFAEQQMEQSGKYVAVRHTKEGTTRMIGAATTLFQGLIERYEVIATQYRLLKSCILTDAEFTRLILDPALPDPRAQQRFNPDARMAELVVTRYEAKAARIRALWSEGKGHTGDRSAWEAYNGLVEAVDHDAELFPTRGGTWRTASLMDGILGKRKHAALEAVVRHAAMTGNN